MTTYEYILTETHERVGLIRLNRPKALNALNSTLVMEVMDALAAFDRYGRQLGEAVMIALFAYVYARRHAGDARFVGFHLRKAELFFFIFHKDLVEFRLVHVAPQQKINRAHRAPDAQHGS